MPSSFSPSLRIELIAPGEQAGTWGSTTNTNLGTLVEDAISGYDTVSVTTANQAFTYADGAADQARNAMIELTTTTGAAFAVYAPPSPKTYVIYNASAHVATIYNSTALGNTTAAGTGVAVPAGRRLFVMSNGTNFSLVTAPASSANVANTLVERDGSGNFAAGVITATLTGNVTGNLTGNASTATALQTARTINGVSFDGTANITINTMPIGAAYIQFPGYNAPSTVFGGTWSAVFDSEGIFFRTPGGNATSFGGGIQEDAFQLHRHTSSINLIWNAASEQFAGGSSRQSNSLEAYMNGYAEQGGGTPRTAVETRPRNRTIRVWVRTA